MSVGLAIFLATLMFALLYLYQITRDRWNWRRFLRRSSMAVTALLVLSSLGLVATLGYQKIAGRPEKQTGYADLRLGMTMAEVQYAKGYPPYVLEEPKDQKDAELGWLQTATKDFTDQQHVEDYTSWSYASDANGTRLDIEFAPTTRALNQIACYSQGVMNCPKLLEISDGMSETDTVDRLGKPTQADFNGVTKRIIYKHLGVWFYLVKMKVYMLAVKDFGSITKSPPCKNGSQTCKPWERDWSKAELEPGSTVTDSGDVTPTKP